MSAISADEFSKWGLPAELQFVRHIASGGYGDVVEVVAKTDNRRLAVKRIRNVFRGEVTRFTSALREIAIQQQLQCPFIVKLLQVYVLLPSGESNMYAIVERDAICPPSPKILSPSILSTSTYVNSPSTTDDSEYDPAGEEPGGGTRLWIDCPHGHSEGKVSTASSDPDSNVDRSPESTIEPCYDADDPTCHIYLLFEYMPADLARLCRSPKNLTMDQVRTLFCQLLLSLLYLKQAHVIHRDIKPSNILVDANCNLLLTDFGQATVFGDIFNGTCKEGNPIEIFNRHITTRWYRSPEAIAGTQIGPAADAWAAGCVLGELLGAVLSPACDRRPIFPGTCCAPFSPAESPAESDFDARDDDFISSDDDDDDDDDDGNYYGVSGKQAGGRRSMTDQLSMIVAVRGVKPLTVAMVARASENDLKCIQALAEVKHFASQRESLSESLAGAPECAMDLLYGLLDVNPGTRLTVEEAVKHPWIYSGKNVELISDFLQQTAKIREVSLNLTEIIKLENHSVLINEEHSSLQQLTDRVRIEMLKAETKGFLVNFYKQGP